jgi:hypothetical protein
MLNLIHLIYVSTAMRAFSEEDLLRLLSQSRAKNARLGLTGMLLYSGNNFFQVLEGEPAVVDELFQTIAQDERHMKMVTIIREPISKRSFGEWTMGFADLTSSDLQEITGLNDFFREGSSYAGLNAGRAKKLLNAFKEGRWRSKLNAPTLELVGQ